MDMKSTKDRNNSSIKKDRPPLPPPSPSQHSSTAHNRSEVRSRSSLPPLTIMENLQRKRSVDQLLNQLNTGHVRSEFLHKIDQQVDQALDGVRCKDKRRKSQKSLKDVDKIDLTSPDSMLTQINLKNLLNVQSFHSLPLYYQYKLVKLLPECDQQMQPNGWISLNPTALNNEFFNRAQQLWISRLKDNKLSPEHALKKKLEQEKERLKIDPWKLKHFEPIWGAGPQRYRNSLVEKRKSDPKSNIADVFSKKSMQSTTSNNVIDCMYKITVPTAKRTGQRIGSIQPSSQLASPAKSNQKSSFKEPITVANRRNTSVGYVIIDSQGNVKHVDKLPPQSSISNNDRNLSPLAKESPSAKRRKVPNINILPSNQQKIFLQTPNEQSPNNSRIILLSNLGKIQPLVSTPSAIKDDRSETSRASCLAGSPLKVEADSAFAGTSFTSGGATVTPISVTEPKMFVIDNDYGKRVDQNEVGFIPITSPNKNFNIQVIKNPQVSKYRISPNEGGQRKNREKNACDCGQKPMKVCKACNGFCHQECLDAFGVCSNCNLQAT